MAKRKRARWLWAAWVFTAGGCATVAGLEDGYYVPEGGSGGTGTGGHASAGGEASGGTGTGGHAGAGGEAGGGTGGGAGAGGSGGAGGGDECTPGGKQCVGQTCVEGKCTGECGPEAVRCSENRPQRCDERGGWEDAAPCPAAAPVCEAGKCVPTPSPPSCVGLAETCGPGGNESCCARAEAAPGGRFNRDNKRGYPATVNGFLLDRFEVTVGRFRRFVMAYPGSKPTAGAGEHPLIEGSGWKADWASELPETVEGLTAEVKCNDGYPAWKDTAGDTEHLPMNCLSWYVAFAFCAWDGGRLATEAEWNYAAAGGDEQRAYPWSIPASSTTINDTYAVYQCEGDGSAAGACAFSDIRPVGSRSPAGDGKWRQADLAGNLWEWVLDWYADPYPDDECNNCATMTASDGSHRVVRGGSFTYGAEHVLTSYRSSFYPSSLQHIVGARCARTP